MKLIKLPRYLYNISITIYNKIEFMYLVFLFNFDDIIILCNIMSLLYNNENHWFVNMYKPLCQMYV